MSEVFETIADSVRTEHFLAGFRWGCISAAATLVGSLIWRRWRNDRAPFGGLAAAAAATIAMPVARPHDTGFLIGIGMLALGGAIFPWTRRVPSLPFIAILPGAWIITQSDLPSPSWIVPLVLGLTILGGPLIAWFDEASTTSSVPMLMFAISIAGVWVTVPDTEEALVLLGAMAAPTLVALAPRLVRLGPAGAYAMVGLYLWVVAWGGRGRQGSVVGAAAALGMLLAAPIATWLARTDRVATSGWRAFLLLLLHGLLVAAATRLAGLRSDPIDAAIIAVPAIVVTAVLWMLIERQAGRFGDDVSEI